MSPTIPEPAELSRAVGRVVAHVRVVNQWSQEYLAARADLSQNGISEIEAARRGIALYTFFKLAHALNLKPVQFLEMVISRLGQRPEPLPRLGTRKPNPKWNP